MSELTPSLAEIIAEQQQGRASFFEDAARDVFLRELLAATEELCVLSDRLDTAMRLTAAGLVVDEEAIDQFEADDDLQAERLAQHRARFAQLFERLVKTNG